MRLRKFRFHLVPQRGTSFRKPAHPVSQSSGLRIILALLVLSSAQTQSQSQTGIEGVITVSPTRPGPIRAGSEIPNAAPLPNAVFTVGNEKGKVTSFTTDSDGRFRISLKPGHYVIVLAEHRFPRPCGPFDVDVVSGKMTKVEWRCDTGMR
jgi:Prealbumin-like fold domain